MRGITLGVFSTQRIYDADFQTNVLDVAQTNSILIPEKPVLEKLNKLMVDMKNIGVYQSSDTLSNFALGVSGFLDFKMIDWKKSGNIYTPYGGLINNITGIRGDGNDSYIDTNFNPATMGEHYTLNDASRSTVVYQNFVSTNSSRMIIDGTVNSFNTMYNSDSTGHRINSGISNLSQSSDLTNTGFKSISRDSSSAVSLFNSGVVTSRSVPSTIVENANQYIFSNGSSKDSRIGVSIYFMGASIPYPMSQSFRTIYNQFLSDSGLSPIA